jgi:hypothetical protein
MDSAHQPAKKTAGLIEKETNEHELLYGSTLNGER